MQNTFYLDLSTSRATPDWLDAEMAEQLRHSVEARQLLEAEYEQVSAIRLFTLVLGSLRMDGM